MKLHEVLQLDRPLVGLDLETTGVDPKRSGIVELGLEIMVPGKPVKEYRTLINPMMPIPPEATKIHGISNADVADAPTFLQLADNLLKGFSGCDFCGFNVFFDLRQMLEEFIRAGKDWSYEGARILDGFRLWQLAEQRTLSHAVDRWLRQNAAQRTPEAHEALLRELESGEAHTALYDVKMATRVIAAQLESCAFLPRDVQRLHDLQWPDRFDADGKLRWRNRELCFAFGKHRDTPLREVPKGYLNFVLGADFSPLVKQTVANALKGEYPLPPVTVEEDKDDEPVD